MDQNAIITQLIELTADLIPSSQTTADDLERAQVAVALSIAAGQTEAFLLRAPGIASPEPDLATLRSLTEIAQRALKTAAQPQLVVRREFASGAIPFPQLGPTQVAGRAIVDTHGPFLDRVGRPVWIDVFSVLPLVGVVRQGSTQPFLFVAVPPALPSADKLLLGPGSIWLAAATLTHGAPTSGHIGLRIGKGTVAFGSVVELSASPIVVPKAANVTLSLELDAPPPPAGTGPGTDSRQAQLKLPAQATFTVDANRATLTQMAETSVTVFGTRVTLKLGGNAPTYDPLSGRVAIPCRHDIASLRVASSSTLAAVTGEAPILEASWSLPVTLASPATLGAAEGAGGIGLRLDQGLQVKWVGRDAAAACGPTTIVVEPSVITLTGTKARVTNGPQRIPLWQLTQPKIARGELRLRLPTPFSFLFASQAMGLEAFNIQTSLVVALDPPRTVNRSRFPFASPSAIVAFLQDATGTTLVADATVPQTPGWQALALKNLVLKTSNAVALGVTAPFVNGGCPSGKLALTFVLGYALPILPDPYASSFPFNPRVLGEPRNLGNLSLLEQWQPDHFPVIDIQLPSTAMAGIQPQAIQPSPPPEGATLAPVALPADPAGDDARALLALQERFNSVVDSGGDAFALLDLSTNVSLFGVAYAPSEQRGITPGTTTTAGALGVADLFLEARGGGVHVLTLPAVQWEPVLTASDPQDPNFPRELTFANCGGITEIAANTVELIPLAPRPALDALLTTYNRVNDPRPVAVRFTLPFGIVAVAEIMRTGSLARPGQSLSSVAPSFRGEGLSGGDQLSIRAQLPLVGFGAHESPSLPGLAVQLHNAQFNAVPTPYTVLTPIDVTFNLNFGPSAPAPRVPVTRLDLSGFGESLFSDWRNPAEGAGLISKAQFNVIVGRTSFEVVQARSLLYPYAVKVVRTITIERQNDAAIARHDSGWQAVSDGTYSYPKPGLITHPGVVRGFFNVSNIRDTGQRFTTSDSSELMAVRFDGDLTMENAVLGAGPRGVPVRDQLGYVQLTDPHGFGQLAPDQFAQLIAAVGPLGGAIDCVLDIGGSGQRMRVLRVGIAATPGMGGPEFAMAAWGSPSFPGGGQWSFLRQAAPGDAPQPLDRDQGVPLVRAGAASAPQPTSPYRFADPEDTLRPDAPAADYGIVHSTGTQRLFFPRPKIEVTGAPAITSTRPPLLADPYLLSTSVGLFPRTENCIPFPDANYALQIEPGGNFKLQRQGPGFTVPPLQRTLIDANAVRTIVYYADENGNPSTVTIAIDTAAPVPWSTRITNTSIATESGSRREMSRIVATLDASAASPTKFRDARYVFGPPLKPVQELVSFLEQFGPLPPLSVAMTNESSLEVGSKISLAELLDFLAPGAGDLVKQFVDQLDITITEKLLPTKGKSKAQFEFVIKIPTPFTPVVSIGLGKFIIQVASDSGETMVFQVGTGVGVSFLVGPFQAVVYYALTMFGIVGDVVFGLGASALFKGTIDLKVVSIDTSAEAKTALLHVKCNAGADSTIWAVGQVTFAIELTIAFVIDINFEDQVRLAHTVDGGPCPLPDVV